MTSLPNDQSCPRGYLLINFVNTLSSKGVKVSAVIIFSPLHEVMSDVENPKISAVLSEPLVLYLLPNDISANVLGEEATVSSIIVP